mmetsp:Transcript_3925/g.6157  ORF Transcript_3925/g.6157 Transcript_3925/m.6157 type:complete len:334 (-) Transcript_3925:31-1032(-)
MQVPVINLQNDMCSLSCEWDKVFREVGCCILTGHDIPGALFTDMIQETNDFFTQPLEYKMNYCHGPYGNPNGGYTPPESEAVSQSMADSDLSTQPDLVESFVLNQRNAQKYADIFPKCCSYLGCVQALLHRLHDISANALELEERDYFRKYYDPSHPDAQGCDEPSYALRLAYYPPQLCSATSCLGNDPTDIRPRYGAHTDYMGYTILRADVRDWSSEGSAGLEIFSPKCDQWFAARVPDELRPTALIVNAGDLLQRWTNGRWLSPVHRVASPRPRSEAAARSRVSIVFFSGPMNDSLISTIPSCMPSTEGGTTYEPVVARDYLMSKINPTAL